MATSGGIGQHRRVTDYLNRIMLNFGSFITGSTGVSMRQSPRAFANAERRAFRLGEDLAEAIGAKRSYPAQGRMMEANRVYFRDLVTMHKDDWSHEYKYWQRMGNG